MKRALELEKYILLFFVVAVIVSGFYSDVCETNKLIFEIDCSLEPAGQESQYPEKDRADIKAANTVIATVAEIKEAGTTRETVRRTERHPGHHRIRSISLVLYLCLLPGICLFDGVPFLLPPVCIDSGRRVIVSYIHLQDGEK